MSSKEAKSQEPFWKAGDNSSTQPARQQTASSTGSNSGTSSSANASKKPIPKTHNRQDTCPFDTAEDSGHERIKQGQPEGEGKITTVGGKTPPIAVSNKHFDASATSVLSRTTATTTTTPPVSAREPRQTRIKGNQPIESVSGTLGATEGMPLDLGSTTGTDGSPILPGSELGSTAGNLGFSTTVNSMMSDSTQSSVSPARGVVRERKIAAAASSSSPQGGSAQLSSSVLSSESSGSPSPPATLQTQPPGVALPRGSCGDNTSSSLRQEGSMSSRSSLTRVRSQRFSAGLKFDEGESSGYSRYQVNTDDDDFVEFREEFDVFLHVYDLSGGLVSKFSTELTGETGVEGMLHSGVVVYGFEYFFEGGIQRTPSGMTRFGAGFRTIALGSTTITLDTFERWVREETPKRFRLDQYQTVGYNCHHFADAACQFLLSEPAPTFLFENTAVLANCPAGKFAIPLADRITGGYQYILTQQVKTHNKQRRYMHRRRAWAMQQMAVNTIPPLTTYLFSNTSSLERTILQLETVHDDLLDGFKLSSTQVQLIRLIAKLMAAGQHFLEPDDVKSLIDILAQTMENRDTWGLAPLLDVWRTLVLNLSFVGCAVYDRRLNLQLLLVAKQFQQAPFEVRLSFLRLLCNLFRTPHGAIILTDRRRTHRIVQVVGLALIQSKYPALAVMGASLACNLVIASTVLCKGSFDNEMRRADQHGSEHALERLMTIVVFHINTTSDERVRVRLLLTVYRFVISGKFACRIVARQQLQVQWRAVYDKTATEETRDLLRLIQVLCYNYNADDYSEDSDDEEGSVVAGGGEGAARRSSRVDNTSITTAGEESIATSLADSIELDIQPHVAF